ncbi:RagB/SusD family nutrient uptake outer membrane protein [Bacteroides thetaiotaomicron]|nr:RagB/SusD family nutrient uptake outer membrane protein [Bacteroides thetaiotaomicron]
MERQPVDFGDFTRCTDGDHYVSQSYDERKWALAAAAAKKVIDLGRYQLYTVAASTDAEHPESGNYGTYVVTLPQEVPTAEFPNGVGMGDKKVVDPYRSYAEMFNGELAINQNPEFIWCSSTAQVGSHMGYVFPLNFGGSSCLCVPQHIVDQFYMADGRDIKNSSSAYPYISRPYDKTCVTTEDKVLSEGYKISQGTYLAYTNREPRFYVNIGYSHAWWAMGSTTESAKKNVNIDYWNGANSGKNHSNNNVYNITGYTSRKYINPQDAMSGSGARQKDKSFPIIRYAEILLAYAEALNNLTQAYEIDGQTYTRDTEAIKYYFNQIRYRAGIPGLTADDLITVEAFNKVVQRERLIELFWEGQRYYDIRRWGIVEDLEREPLMGLNVEQAEWEGFYQPTVIQYKSIIERDFKPKMVWLPLHLDEIRKVSVLDQNPGWDK